MLNNRLELVRKKRENQKKQEVSSDQAINMFIKDENPKIEKIKDDAGNTTYKCGKFLLEIGTSNGFYGTSGNHGYGGGYSLMNRLYLKFSYLSSKSDNPQELYKNVTKPSFSGVPPEKNELFAKMGYDLYNNKTPEGKAIKKFLSLICKETEGNSIAGKIHSEIMFRKTLLGRVYTAISGRY